MFRRGLAGLSLALGILGLAAPVAADGEAIGRIELTGVIDQVNAAYIEEALRVSAEDGNAAALIVIDSPGGELTSMDRMIKAILASDVPVIAWVAPEGARAGSAATFVTLAANRERHGAEHDHRRRIDRRWRGRGASGDAGTEDHERRGGADPVPRERARSQCRLGGVCGPRRGERRRQRGGEHGSAGRRHPRGRYR